MSEPQSKPAASIAQPQFYNKVAPLSEKGHADWRIVQERDYSFTAKTNAVLITAIEFVLASAEYPLVFIPQGDTYAPVAVLGLKPEQNLFVDEKGQWDAQYIPAYIRRYPFILAGDNSQPAEKSSYTVCIDESYAGFNRKQGERLFTDDGKQTEYLEKMIGFMKDFQAQGLSSERFCRTLKKHDLLEPMQANVASEEGEKFSVAGFHVVSMERLKACKPLVLSELVKSDDMTLIYQHLASVSNFSRLIERYSKLSLAKAS